MVDGWYIERDQVAARHLPALDVAPVEPPLLSPYDGLIGKYAAAAGIDWRLIAAIIYEESRFAPNSVSDAGAYGLMQVRYLYHPRVNGGCKACAGSSWPNTEHSTAFDVDLFAAEMRGCYNGMSTYLGDTKGDVYGCIASWYSGAWSAGGHTWYADSVRSYLSQKPWLGWGG